jgi:hypothetical protein
VLLVVEGGLRISAWGFYFLQERENRGSIFVFSDSINQFEKINKDVVSEKKLVILCIGESTTGLGGGNSWPSQLQRILNNIQDERSFHVINKGLPGQDTSFIVKFLPEYLEKYNPHLVLAMVGINDNRFVPVKAYATKSLPDNSGLLSLVEQSRTYGLIKWIIRSLRLRIYGDESQLMLNNRVSEIVNESTTYHLSNPNVTDLHPLTIRNLNHMVRMSSERGSKFIFVQYALRKIDVLEKVIIGEVSYISNYQIFVDLLGKYPYDELFSDEFAGDFGHATTFGNRIIADNVARQLLMFLNQKK